MAQFDSNISNGYQLHITATEESYSVETNSSYVSWELWLTNSDARFARSNQSFYASINGTEIYNNTQNVSLNRYDTYVLGSGGLTIYHNDDGSKYIGVYAKYSPDNTSLSYMPHEALEINTGEWLTTIPRKSTVSSTSANIGENINIHINRASGSFYHTLEYYFNNISGTIATNVGTDYSWTLPDSFYAQIPNSSSSWGRIRCLTYINGNYIGDNYCTFNVYCNENICKPNISVTLSDTNTTTTNLTGSTATLPVLVDNKSIAHFAITTSAKNSATLSDILINNVSIGVVNSKDINPNVDTYSIVVKDSRGFTNSITYQSSNSASANYFKRIVYTTLSLNANTYRTSQVSDDMNLKLNGNYYNGNFKDGTSNALDITWQVREKDGNYTAGQTTLTPTITNNTYKISTAIKLTNPLQTDGLWNYQKIYEFRFTATDLLSTINNDVTVTKGIPNFAIFKNAVMFNGKVVFYQ